MASGQQIEKLNISSQVVASDDRARLRILDGWRALSILAVVAGHWLPLGPSDWQLNSSAAAGGMALFFCLSGFLITKILLDRPVIRSFLLKRMFRIIPLAWLAMAVLAVANNATLETAIANFAFYSNIPPSRLMEGGEHLWSLCVEVQFYLFAALLVGLCGRKGLYLLPLLAIVVTGLRISDGEIISIVTWHRVDEILVGAIVALVWQAYPPSEKRSLPAWISPFALGMLFVSSLPQAGELGYLRPYLAALAIGTSLYAFPVFLRQIWESGPARYIAELSYAIYVWHVVLQATPLGGEDVGTLEKYLLRVPLALCTWALSHISTRYFERPLTRLGRRLASPK